MIAVLLSSCALFRGVARTLFACSGISAVDSETDAVAGGGYSGQRSPRAGWDLPEPSRQPGGEWSEWTPSLTRI